MQSRAKKTTVTSPVEGGTYYYIIVCGALRPSIKTEKKKWKKKPMKMEKQNVNLSVEKFLRLFIYFRTLDSTPSPPPPTLIKYTHTPIIQYSIYGIQLESKSLCGKCNAYRERMKQKKKKKKHTYLRVTMTKSGHKQKPYYA